MRLVQSDIHYIISEATKRILENNYKNFYTKFKASKHAYGKKQGKSREEINSEISDYFAKLQALKDINQERNVLKMDPHERRFNNPITPETFEIDFDDFEDYINYNDEQIDTVSLDYKDRNHEDYLNDIYYDRKGIY